MERKNAFAKALSVKSARNERERKMIETYNAAMIGCAKTVNRYGMELDYEEVEEAGAEAGLAALEKADFNGACIAYGGRCGQSHAIKRSERVARERKRFSSMDSLKVSWTDDDEMEYEDFAVVSDDFADREILESEEKYEAESKKKKFWSAFGKLPEKDRTMYLMLSEGKSYSDIAVVLGCTENALYKRRKDGEARFAKLFAESRSCSAA